MQTFQVCVRQGDPAPLSGLRPPRRDTAWLSTTGKQGMAIYHFSVKTVSRARGRSAVAAAAYRSGTRLADERTGEMCDYRRKQGVEHSEIMAPTEAPGWARKREALWNAAEAAERRKNSVTAREYEIALPAELSSWQRQEAARAFAGWLVARFGVAADIAIHAPGKEGDQRNHHVHILTTTRAMGTEGLGAKTRELDDRRSGAVEAARATWAEIANGALEWARVAERVDHRSHARQGIEDAPTIHLGPAAAALARRGMETERGSANRLIHLANQALKGARLVVEQAGSGLREAANQVMDRGARIMAELGRMDMDKLEEALHIRQAEKILQERQQSRPGQRSWTPSRRRDGPEFGL